MPAPSTGPTPIAIVAMGAALPGASSPEALWPIVEQGRDMVRAVSSERWTLDPEAAYSAQRPAPDRVYSTHACLIEGATASARGGFEFDVGGLALDPNFVARLDPSVHVLLHAGKQAWASAVTDGVDRSRAGVILGNIALPTDGASALSDWIVGQTLERRVFGAAGMPAPVQRRAAPGVWNRWVAGLPAGVLAAGLGLGGDQTTLDAACASSLYALHLAAAALRRGEADIMLAGGMSRPSSLYTQMGFSQLGALSPAGRCSPFDLRGDGLIVGEGAGVLVLKRLDDAQRDGDRIWALVRGTGLSNDLDGNLLAPSTEGQLRSMRAAYAQASWAPGDVDFIECHATGTPIGDAVEVESITRLREGSDAPDVPLGAVKANVGHLLTGAGAVALIKTVLAMDRGVIPPVANFEQPSARIDLEHAPVTIPTEPSEWPSRGRARRAAVSGFGFGGTNAHVLLEDPSSAPSAATVVQVPARLPTSPIAIVGMSGHIGPWKGIDAIRERLFGESATESPAPKADFGGQPSPDGWFIDTIDVPMGVFRIPPRELAELLPQQLLALQLAGDALSDVRGAAPHGPRAGVFVGVELDFGTTDYHLRWSVRAKAEHWAKQLQRPSEGPEFDRWVNGLCDAMGPALNADRTMGGLASIAASRIAREFRFGGPSYTLSSEDTSGMTALITAVRALQAGELDAALVGAVDLGGDVRARLSQAATRPEVVSGQPLDVASEGATPSEGAVALVLKRLDDAERDGDRVYAVVAGAGAASGPGLWDGGPGAQVHRSSAARAIADAACDASISVVDTAASGLPAHDAAEQRGLAGLADDATRLATCATFGDSGAVSGLLGVVASALRLHHRLVEPVRGLRAAVAGAGRPIRGLQPWLSPAGQRQALVAAASVTGHVAHVVVAEGHHQPWHRPPQEALFVVEATDRDGLVQGLHRLADVATDVRRPLDHVARAWRQDHGRAPSAPLAVALVARDLPQLASLASRAAEDLAAGTDPSQRGGARVWFAPEPLGPGGELAFVFPGSGSHFPGMGRAVGLDAPAVLTEQSQNVRELAQQLRPGLSWNATQAEMDADPRALILAQVSVGILGSDALRSFGVKPDAVIGYSLGETAGLFSLGAWKDRDAMLGRVFDSALFTQELAGECRAAARLWQLPEGDSVKWQIGVVEASSARVDEALAGRERVYRLIVNTPSECVVGGDAEALAAFVEALAVPFHPLPGVTTVHCDVARSVEAEYRALHVLPTTPPEGVRFYSGAWGRSYPLSSESAASSVTDQALVGVDFPRVVRQAFDDGVRIFVELGPGGSCTRMIHKILGDRPFVARSISNPGTEGRPAWLRTLAMLVAHRVPLDLDALFDAPLAEEVTPPTKTIQLPVGRAAVATMPPLPEAPKPEVPAPAASPTPPTPAAMTSQPTEPAPVPAELPADMPAMLRPAVATAAAHAAFLDASAALTQLATAQLQAQLHYQTQAAHAAVPGPAPTPSLAVPRAFTREQCLAFATGRVVDVLGPTFAAVDDFPTRVRLPDEPLMLVDRILDVDATPGAMTSGRIVTEHDVLHDKWYLDAGRIPTCVAVEAGQADLFLSGYLGIDTQTRGLAVYRLLDATVTFHDRLPVVGETIHYDIKIERFFRQGDTWLFQFQYDATVDGRLLMTMREGCAGFFSEAELAAGRGVVDPKHVKPRASSSLADRPTFLSPTVTTLDATQLDALRTGDLSVLGSGPGALAVRNPLTIPGGLMRLVHRITELDANGGAYGLGFVRGEADIHPDDWFITCHFVDDRVMPGTLMYECCMHTLRVFLLSIGWIGDADEVAFEPKLGVCSRLKCRGQVLDDTQVVTYEVTMREFGQDPEPWVICDARMYADGKRIVDIEDMSARLTGTTAERLAAQCVRPREYDKASLEAFAYGKPSDAFGARYEVFDGPSRSIARLPGAPFQFIDRVPEAHGQPFVMEAGAHCRAEVDRETWAWTLGANRQAAMPFAVLLEIGLQACGWLAAYAGSGLTSDDNLHFRNLGGRATLHRAIDDADATLVMRAAMTSVSASGGMIIQHFNFGVYGVGGEPIYEGTTYFGFFSADALREQVGIRDAKLYTPTPAELASADAFDVSELAPLPDAKFRMVARVDALIREGGPHGLGAIIGSVDVDPSAWFFQAHFFEDPVWPGSLGLEAHLQLLKVFAVDRWELTADAQFATFVVGHEHEWIYRGQVVPTGKRVEVQATIVEVDDDARRLVADGFLIVDGRPIYEIKRFALEVSR